MRCFFNGMPGAIYPIAAPVQSVKSTRPMAPQASRILTKRSSKRGAQVLAIDVQPLPGKSVNAPFVLARAAGTKPGVGGSSAGRSRRVAE